MTKRDAERIKSLTDEVRELARMILWLTPFLSAKAKESGDVAGLQVNAEEAARHARALLNTYDAEDRIRAKELAGAFAEHMRPEEK
jgi:hypothetical protein